MNTVTHRSLISATALGFLILGACQKEHTEQQSTSTTSESAGTPGATAMATPDTTKMAQPSDAQIFADLTVANAGEIASGKMALAKSSNPKVKEFARQMINAHTQMQKEGVSLAAKLHVVKAPADSMLTKSGETMAAHLKAMTKSSDFDTAYANSEVAAHQAVLDFLKQTAGHAVAPELNTALTNTEPTVSEHLDMAKALQAQLASPPAAAAK